MRRIVVLVLLLVLAAVLVFVNVYPPIYELQQTYYCSNWDVREDDNHSDHYRFYRYYLIQNPPKNEEELVQLTDEYIRENDLYLNAPDPADADKAGDRYDVWLIFCKKSYSPFGIHRLWHGKLDCDIQSYGEYYIVIYHAEIRDGNVTGSSVSTYIDDVSHEIRNDFK
ncbi:MAG: hypothetical protein ACI4J5_05240 [Oscillospiraceae bacterium]